MPTTASASTAATVIRPLERFFWRGLFLVLALISVRIVRIGRIALIVVLAGLQPPIKRVVIARRVLQRLVGVLLLRLLGVSLLRLIVIIVLRGPALDARAPAAAGPRSDGRDAPAPAAYSGSGSSSYSCGRGGGGSGVSWRARCIHAGGLGRASGCSSGGSYCCGRTLARDCSGSRRGLGRGPQRIILPDQPCELRKRIALAATLVGGWKRSVLISISHRDDASPTGQRQTRHVKQTMTSVAPARYPTDPHP